MPIKFKLTLQHWLQLWVVLSLILFTNLAQAQYVPYFQNYDVSQYNAGNQNWGISKADDGHLYVANNSGLLEFDGLKWSFNALPNKTTIRSVLAVNDKIYVGSYEEFGFWKRNRFGRLEYHSLSEHLSSKEFLNEEFWQIVQVHDSIVFRSFLNLYIYKDGKITKITPPSTILSCSVIDDILYVATLTNGIFVVEQEALIPFIEHPNLVDTKIISITNNNGRFFITTSMHGAFIYENGTLRPWVSEIAKTLKEQQLNGFSTLSNGNMVFGTIKNGVYVTDRNGKILFNIHKENGLINNTVLAQLVDNDDQLWLGLDNGLASADMKSPYLFYNDVSGNLGAVYDVIDYEGTTYIGSNTGLYYLDKDNSLQFIEGSQGQVWDLQNLEGDLLCGHNNGTYRIINKQLEHISPYTGGWVIKKVVGLPKTYIQGTYAGLVRLQKEGSKWTATHLGQTTIPSRFLVFEDAYTAWVAHASKGLYRVKFNEAYHIIDIKNYDNKGLLSSFNVRVYSLKNDLLIKTNNGWQKYESLLDSIVPSALLDARFGKQSYIISEDDIETLAVKTDQAINFKAFPDDGIQSALNDKYYKKRLIVGYENISRLKDSVLGLSLNNGFMMFNAQDNPMTSVLYPPYFEMISIDSQLVDLESLKAIELPNNFNSLNIHLTSPKSVEHYFEYAIADIDTLAHWHKLDNHRLQFSNITHGDYEFKFRTVNHLGETSAASSLKVTVLPPWYLSTLGYLLYGVLVLLVVFLFYRLHRRKIKKQKRQLQLKFEQEQEELLKEQAIENERRMATVRNEALKNEVTLKSKQLANTAMALVKKNETLLEIKNEIADHKKVFDNYFSYRKLIKKIDSSIGHKDEWEVFEHNFNQVHEAFFNQLKRKHPKLTARDLRICAYIKMNLTTKEIAPLLNISIRGVETQRYRLRVKLKLESDQSLTDYLMSIQ